MTRFIIGTETLGELSEKLYVYDVEQKGWEHEGLGLAFNAKHVLIHLTQDLVRKDLKDSRTLANAVVPDMVQYALRFARWSDSEAEQVLPDIEQYGVIADKSSSKLGRAAASYVQAVGTLGQALHEIDHEKTAATANEALPEQARRAAGFLLLGAGYYSDQLNIDVPRAFDTRLAEIRKRFGIPIPS